jgi:hypothetical protein
MDYDENETLHVERLLRIHRRTLNKLDIQIAQSTEMEAPVHKLTQRDDERDEIRQLEEKLRSLQSQAPTMVEVSSTSTQPGRAAELLPPVRVFVSSTMSDLQPERDAAERAIETLDLAAVRAETNGAQSISPYEVSCVMAKECDIYLGIYGGQYGSIVEGDGRSITEIEYHTAREQKKPILIYRETGVEVEPEQAEFLRFVGDMTKGHKWCEFGPDDVPGNLIAWIQADVKREVENHSEWRDRAAARDRVLLASLGLSPGAITGLYHALARIKKRPSRVITFSPNNKDVRSAAGVCQQEFRQLGVPYDNQVIAGVQDIRTDGDAQQFKGMFDGLMREILRQGADALVGITGGRTVMGALMAVVVQTADVDPQRVILYHLDVDEDIERDGRLPDLWKLKGSKRWAEVLNPGEKKCRLVRVPYATCRDE